MSILSLNECFFPCQQLFITDELLRSLCEQTNLQAMRQMEAQPITTAHVPQWVPVGVKEMKRFLALLFLTGIVRKPHLHMYWSVDELHYTPFFGATMTRNRFQAISRYFHFNDSMNLDASDRMYRVRPVLDHLLAKFKELYQPGEEISIDEGMLPWRGRLAFRVYNPRKPVKYGIKNYMLCDSRTGYCYNMIPYVGEHMPLRDTVFGLLNGLKGLGHTLFMDNFYNSVGLCHALLEEHTNVCGTLRAHRGEPPIIRDVTVKKLQPGKTIMQHDGKVMVLAWRFTNIVRMVSTCHEDQMKDVEVWRRGMHQKVTVHKPLCVTQYNEFMNGVDRLDQNLSYYPTIRKTLKWPRKYVLYLFQVAIFNASVIYRAKNPRKKMTLLAFIQGVIRAWVSKTSEEGEDEPRRHQRRMQNDPLHRLDGDMRRHVEEHIPPTGKKGRKASRRCQVCSQRGKRSETVFWCKACKVPLHHGECFHAFHTKQNYS